jgi:hypothetical protein
MQEAAPHVEDDERLTLLYNKRQELLKELTDIDNQIKAAEHRASLKLQQHAAARQTMVSTGNVEIDSIREVLEKAMHDQAGLREAQKVIEVALRPISAEAGETEESVNKRWRQRNIVVREIINFSSDLIIDPHGNYLLQKALTYFKNNGSHAPNEGDVDYNFKDDRSLSEIIILLETLGSSLGDVASNMHGTRAVQRIVDCLASIEEFELFCDLIANELVSLIKDLNGNHAVSRLLVSPLFMTLGDTMETAERREKGQAVRKDVYHIVAANCVEICRNRQGCCIIQRCLQWAPEPFRTEIVNAALNSSLKLVQDPFGNYVVQYILDLQQNLLLHNPQQAEQVNYTNRIIRQLLHNIAPLSCNKFSSNVIEKCFKTASPDVRQLLIDEVTDPHALPRLVTDSFGNYVVQTAIVTASDDAQFIQLRDAILPLQHLLKNSPYGVKIESKLMKRHRESTRSAQQKEKGKAPSKSRQRAAASLQQQMMAMPVVGLPIAIPQLPNSPAQQQLHHLPMQQQFFPQHQQHQQFQSVPQQQQQFQPPVPQQNFHHRHHHHHHHHQSQTFDATPAAASSAPFLQQGQRQLPAHASGGSWAVPGQPTVYTAHQQNAASQRVSPPPVPSPYMGGHYSQQ